jgi:hypothetical protein
MLLGAQGSGMAHACLHLEGKGKIRGRQGEDKGKERGSKEGGGEEVVVRKLLSGSCCQQVVVRKLLSASCCQEVVARMLLPASSCCSCFGVVCTYLTTVEQPHFRNVVVLAVFRVVMFPVVFRIQIRTPPTPIMQYFVRGILHHAFKNRKKKHIENKELDRQPSKDEKKNCSYKYNGPSAPILCRMRSFAQHTNAYLNSFGPTIPNPRARSSRGGKILDQQSYEMLA